MIMTVVLDFYIIHYLTNNLHQTKPLRTKNIINIITHQELTMGFQHVEFRKEILQTMQVGLRLNMEADEKSAYYNVQVGVGPNMENFEKKFYRQCKLWVPTWKLTKSQLPISVEYKNTH